ncbi:hypothetical protein BTE77_02365 [Ensifer adhaerens]|nr:hypothetical protein BTE77_02365 [Ensifer adhaerens]
MAVFKRTPSTTEPFRVPSLAEASTEYASIVDKQQELQERQSALTAERRELEAKVAAAPVPAYRPAIATLLGESVESTSAELARLKEISALDADIKAALDILRQRSEGARGKASMVVCDSIKPEYARRVAAICKALEVVHEARAAYTELVDDLERNNISWTRLGPMQPTFLGSLHDGHVHRYIAEARGLGYVD